MCFLHYFTLMNVASMSSELLAHFPPPPPALGPNTGQGLLIFEVSRSHSLDTPQSVGLLWMNDQLVAETST